MKIFAHRGDSWFYPENTILAFKKALSLPIYCIELDIHKSKDNQLVVIHDETINRTFKGKGFVKDYSLKELQSFKCKKPLFKYNIVDLAHDNNLDVFVYTVNTPLSVLKMIKYNVDGVFTDFPNLIYNILIKTIDIFHS